MILILLSLLLQKIVAADLWNSWCLQNNRTSWVICQPSAPEEDRVLDLLSRINLSDKILALGQDTPPLNSVGLPAYNWWSEAAHGISHVSFTGNTTKSTNTALPITLSAAFNRTLWKSTGALIGREARAFMNVGNAYSTFWAPVINILRDPRWGRNIETPGEDPYLTGQYAVNFVQGFEHSPDVPYPIQAATCCKHFFVNSLDNWDGYTRYGVNEAVPQQDLADTYLPAFQECVQVGGTSGIMSSYNAVNGIPSPANAWLLQTVLREQWGFEGYVTSDCDADANVYSPHNFTSNETLAVQAVLEAGTNVDCGSFVPNYAQQAYDEGLIDLQLIDDNLFMLFRVLIRLGLFDPPTALNNIGVDQICTADSQELARDGVRQGVILVQNTNNVLPLQLSEYVPHYLLDAHDIYPRKHGNRHLHSRDDEDEDEDHHGHGHDHEMKKDTYKGEHNDRRSHHHRTHEERHNHHHTHNHDHHYKFEYHSREKAGNVVMIGPNAFLNDTVPYYGSQNPCNCTDGYWTPFDSIYQYIPSLTYVAGVDSVAYDSPSDIPAAIAAAQAASLVILALGSDLSLESEGNDRVNISFSPPQISLISAISAAVDPSTTTVVAVVFSGGAMDMTPLLELPGIPAVLHAGQPSVHVLGVGDIIFGQNYPPSSLVSGACQADSLYCNRNFTGSANPVPVSPAGRFSQTVYPSAFTSNVSMLEFSLRPGSSQYAPFTTPGRTHRFYTGPTVLPFGFGLSYTSFNYTQINNEAFAALRELQRGLVRLHGTSKVAAPVLQLLAPHQKSLDSDAITAWMRYTSFDDQGNMRVKFDRSWVKSMEMHRQSILTNASSSEKALKRHMQAEDAGFPVLAATLPTALRAPITSLWVNVTNTGTVASDDVVIGYIIPPGAGQNGTPLEELLGFERVHVLPGQTVSVYLGAQASQFTFVNQKGEREVLYGKYTIRFGVRKEFLHESMGFEEVSLILE